MTIKNNEPMSMVEVQEYVDKDSEVSKFIKKFTKLTPKDAAGMKKSLNGLGLMKMKSEELSKVIDILPENEEDLNKIFVSISLDEDESKKILDVVKQFK